MLSHVRCARASLLAGKRAGRWALLSSRYSSSSSPKINDTDPSHRYSDSVTLPSTTFPSRSLMERNDQYLETATAQVYRAQAQQSPTHFKSPHLFVLHDGPPYANGDLHLGHSINKVLKDIVNRSQLLNNKNQVLYVPGFDCHGLPIELKALNSLKQQSEDAQKETQTKKKKKTKKKKSNVDEDLTTELDALALRNLARQHALSTIAKQTETFKKFGVMGEWDSPYRTLDKEYEIAQLRIFKKMYNRNMIKRQKKPVYWGCETGTALAEGELEYNDAHISRAAYLKFPIIQVKNPGLAKIFKEHGINYGNVDALIWTSTPWTIAANSAISVNESFEYTLLFSKPQDRYLIVLRDLADSVLALKEGECLISEQYAKTGISVPGHDLVGNFYKNPIITDVAINRFPIIHGKHVTSSAGTGLVHTAPGHGQDDYLVGLSNGIEAYSPVDNKGQYTDELRPGFESLRGMKVLKEGTKEMLKILQEHQMILQFEPNYVHSYPYDWRSKRPIIIRATPQWFTDLSVIKDDAIDAISKVRFYPERGHTRLASFINNRSEWCISRQRFWGVPIPVFYHKDTGEPLINEQTIEHVIATIDELGTDAWFEPEADGSVARWLPEELKSVGGQYVKGTDTVDVWFDSGSSWAFLENLLSKKNKLEGRERVADVYLEGSDQHRGWFQSSLLTKIAADSLVERKNTLLPRPAAPYSTVITHGFTLDANGMKMSKSIGNTIDPLSIIYGDNAQKIPRIGVDGLRLWIASNDYTTDLSLSPVILKHVADNLRKIRITFRYLLGNLHDYEPAKFSPEYLTAIDKYVLIKLRDLLRECETNYGNYQYNRVVQNLNYFMNIELSATYFNVIKDKLYAEDHSRSQTLHAIQFVLSQVLQGFFHILSPILPVITQEAWEHTPAVLKKNRFTDISTNPSSPLTYNYDFENLEKVTEHPRQKQQILDLFNNNVWKLKDEVLKLIEYGRKEEKTIRNALETNVIVNFSSPQSPLQQLLQENFKGEELADALVVSQVQYNTPVSNASGFDYIYTKKVEVGGEEVEVHVVNSAKHKCPRCWKFASEQQEELCHRCKGVLHKH